VLAIIELAHALGMSVTAEGAETHSQLDTLRGMRSDHAQGYLIGRPMPSSSLTNVLLGAAPVVEQMPIQTGGQHDASQPTTP